MELPAARDSGFLVSMNASSIIISYLQTLPHTSNQQDHRPSHRAVDAAQRLQLPMRDVRYLEG